MQSQTMQEKNSAMAKDEKRQNQKDNGDYEHATRGQVNGAALVGGLAGLLLGGPILGVLGAGISACLAATDDGKAGDFVRKGGTAVDDFGKEIQHEEKERHILDKTAEKLHLEEGVKWLERTLSPSTTPTRSGEEGRQNPKQ